MNPVETTGDGVRLRLRIQPRASRTEVVGLHGDAIRIRIAAPPVDGAANDEVIRFLAALFGVSARAVEITAGHGSRQKIARVSGLDAATARAALGLPLP